MGVLCSTADPDGILPPNRNETRSASAKNEPNKKDTSGVVYCATLSKREENMEDLKIAGGFRHRVVMLRGDVLEYKKTTRGRPLGRLSLIGAEVHYDSRTKQIMLQATEEAQTESQLNYFQCESEQEAGAWVTAIADSISRQHGRKRFAIEEAAPSGPLEWQTCELGWCVAVYSCVGHREAAVRRLNQGEQHSERSTATFQGRTTTFTSAKAGHPVTNMVNDNPSCHWEPQSNEGEWVILDLGHPRLVSQFKFLAAADADTSPADLQLSSSDLPGYVWSKWCIAVQTRLPATEGGWSEPLDFSPRVARFWKILLKASHAGSAPRIAQLALFASGFSAQLTTSDSCSPSKSIRSGAHTNPPPRASPRTSLFSALDVNKDGLLQHAELLGAPELTEQLVQAICNKPNQFLAGNSVPTWPGCVSEPITPRSYRTATSAALQLLPRRLHRKQPQYTGVSAELLAAARAELLPALTSALQQSVEVQNGMGGELQLILVSADNGTAQLLDRLVPVSVWQDYAGMWETTLGDALMKQVTTGQLPAAHMILVLCVWGSEMTEQLQATQAMVAAHTAMYPDHKCTVIALHASKELPEGLENELLKDCVVSRLVRSDTLGLLSPAPARESSDSESTAENNVSFCGAAGLGAWTPTGSSIGSPAVSTRTSTLCTPAAPCTGACAETDMVSFCGVRVGLVPQESTGVFSLDQPKMLRKLLEEQPRPEPNPTAPEYVQWACDVVLHLEELLGYIPYKHARGAASCRALEMILSQTERTPSSAANSSIVRVVLVDRTVDLLTPVLSQHTYGGLVDDLFVGDLDKTRAMCAADCRGASTADARMAVETAMFHPSADDLWAKAFDLPLTEALVMTDQMDANFESIADDVRQALEQSSSLSGREIQLLAARSAEILEAQHLLAAHRKLGNLVKTQLTVAVPRPRVSKLVETLTGQTTNVFGIMLCEQVLYNPIAFCKPVYSLDTDPALILDFLMTAIEARDPVLRVLRLICVVSQASSGLVRPQVEKLQVALNDVYGHSAMMTLQSMIYLRLVRVNESKASGRWSKLCKEYQLSLAAQDSSYGYNGYKPLSTMLVQRTRECCYPSKHVSQKLGIPKIDHVPVRKQQGATTPRSKQEAELKQKQQSSCESCGGEFGVFTRKQVCLFCDRCVCNKCLSGQVVTKYRNENGVKEIEKTCAQCALKEEESLAAPDGQTLGGAREAKCSHYRELHKTCHQGASI